MQRGFIQIPILIAIVIGVTVVGTAGYVGVTKYTDTQQSGNEELLVDGTEVSDKELANVSTSTATTTEESKTLVEKSGTETDDKISAPKVVSTPVTTPAPVPTPQPAPTPTATPAEEDTVEESQNDTEEESDDDEEVEESPAEDPDPEPETDVDQTEGEISISLVSASTHTEVGNGLKSAKVIFELVLNSATSTTLLFDPKITVGLSTTTEYTGSSLQYWPTGNENEGYEHIDPKIAGSGADSFTLNEEGVPYVFAYHVSYSEPILYYDFVVDIEVLSHSGEYPPAITEFPLTGSYDTCTDLSHLYEIRVMCGDE